MGQAVRSGHGALISLLCIQNILSTCHENLFDRQNFRKVLIHPRPFLILDTSFGRTVLGDFPCSIWRAKKMIVAWNDFIASHLFLFVVLGFSTPSIFFLQKLELSAEES
jgi:hypothetical protein